MDGKWIWIDNSAKKDSYGEFIAEFESGKKPVLEISADSEYAEMLKLKDFYLERPITEEYLLAPDLLERTVEEFRRTQPFIAILNRAVQYAYDEMM